MVPRILGGIYSDNEVVEKEVYVYRTSFREYLTPSYRNVIILCDVIANSLHAQPSKQPRRR